MRRAAGCLLALTLAGQGASAMEARPNADDPALEQRLLALTADLRCVVCQNESLAESRAPLAKDLRQEVRELMRQGRTDREVVEYLTTRYGDFVLYRPPLKPVTYLLWAGPALFLGVGGIAWFVTVLRRQRAGGADRPADGRDGAAAPFSRDDCR